MTPLSKYDINKVKKEAKSIFNGSDKKRKAPKWNKNKIKRATDWIGNDAGIQKAISKQMGIKK